MGVTFSAYVLLNPDKGLQASTAFGTLSLFSLLRFPLMMLGQTLNNLAQANVSLNRISKFLEKVHEIDDDDASKDDDGNVEMKAIVPTTSSVIIELRDTSYAWRGDEEEEEESEDTKTLDDEQKGSSEPSKHFCLSKIDLVVKRHELVAVVGRVGSGKTTLLRGLLGELYVFISLVSPTHITHRTTIPIQILKQRRKTTRHHLLHSTIPLDRQCHREREHSLGLFGECERRYLS